MSSPVVTIPTAASVEECCGVLEEHQIRRVLVVDERGRICGIVSQADIARDAKADLTAEVVRQVSRPSHGSAWL
jgi:CBS-domain-containing membrane protein